MTTRSTFPVRVLVVGPAPAGPASRGGMASVVRLMRDDPDTRFALTTVPTFVDAHLAVRLWTGVRGMLVASWAILFGRADVLHVHLAHGGSVVRKAAPLAAARLRGVPSVVHGHSFDFSGWLDSRPAPIRRMVRAALRTDHWLVLGTKLADEYRRSLQLPADAVTVLYNPVIIPDATPRPADRHLTVVALGRLGQRKGTYDLIRAVHLLPDPVRARLRVVLAGDGEVDQARSLVSSLQLTDCIEILGWIEPPARDELLRRADILALPSYAEGLPMAVLEAMAYGVVPLTTPVGGIPEAVTDGVDGLLVPPGEPTQLADALHGLAIDDDRRARLAAAARRRAQEFDVTEWRAQLARLWLSLTDPPAG